jgi:hypothetical protein
MGGWSNLTHIKLGHVERLQTRTATSAEPGVPEVAMSCDGGVEQLFPSIAIARRVLPASFALFGWWRSVGEVGKALEIAHVAQGALQSLCRPVQVMEFAPAPQRNGFR